MSGEPPPLAGAAAPQRPPGAERRRKAATRNGEAAPERPPGAGRPRRASWKSGEAAPPGLERAREAAKTPPLGERTAAPKVRLAAQPQGPRLKGSTSHHAQNGRKRAAVRLGTKSGGGRGRRQPAPPRPAFFGQAAAAAAGKISERAGGEPAGEAAKEPGAAPPAQAEAPAPAQVEAPATASSPRGEQEPPAPQLPRRCHRATAALLRAAAQTSTETGRAGAKILKSESQPAPSRALVRFHRTAPSAFATFGKWLPVFRKLDLPDPLSKGRVAPTAKAQCARVSQESAWGMKRSH